MLPTLLLLLPQSHPPPAATCSTSGPATLQRGTARLGGVAISDAPLPAGSPGEMAAACAARCCASTYDAAAGREPCRSWTVHGGNCSLRGLYSAPLAASGAVSGVVYRRGVQNTSIESIRGFN